MRPRLTVIGLLMLSAVCAAQAHAAQGLEASYFANQSLSGSPFTTQVDSTIDFAWGTSAPMDGLTPQKFSVRWIGYVQAPGDGSYQLVAQANGGVRVWLDGALVIDSWKKQGLKSHAAKADAYQAERWYPVIVEYYADGSGAEARLLWQEPASGRTVIAADDWSAGSGLTGSYFANRTLTDPPALVRTDGTINFNWRGNGPDASLPRDDFSVRWEGVLTPGETDDYRLIARTDDGVRVFVDGIQVIDYWKGRSAGDSYSPALTFTEGESYAVVMEFYERGGQASARLDWDRAPDNRHVVPSDSLLAVDTLIGDTSPVSPACIEGIAIDGLPTVTADGVAVDVHPLGDRGWFANVPLAIGTSVEVAIAHGVEPAATQVMSWVPTPLNGAEEVVVRQDDALLFAMPAGSQVSILTESGVASGPTSVPNSGLLQCAFPNDGFFTVSASSPEGEPLGERDVAVVSTTISEKRLISEVGYTRSYQIEATPQSQYLSWGGAGPVEVSVSDTHPPDPGLTLKTKVTKRGAPYVVARLADSGCIAFAGEIEEFTFDGKGPNRGILNLADPVAKWRIEMRPFLPDVWFRLNMFAGKATFAGGAKSGSINTSGLADLPENLPPILPGSFEQVLDEKTGEIIGVYKYIVDVTEGNKACHRIHAGVSNSPWVEISNGDTNNPKYCKIRSFSSLIFLKEVLENEVADSNPEVWGSRDWTLISTEKDSEEPIEYKLRVDDGGSGGEVDNPIPALFGGSDIYSDCKPCNDKCDPVSPQMNSGTKPGRYDLSLMRCDESDGPQSSSFYISKLDIHGVGSTRTKFPDAIPSLPKRNGTVLDPVIVVVSGGMDGPSFYGVQNPCSGEPTNKWTLRAQASDPSTKQNLPPGLSVEWEVPGYTVLTTVDRSRGGSSFSYEETIEVTLPPGRWQPKLKIYQTHEEIVGEDGATDFVALDEPILLGKAEIHSLAVESMENDNVGIEQVGSMEECDGTLFNLSNNAGGVPVDAKLETVSGARARVSLDGYPQNEYWGGEGDSEDCYQVVTVPSGESLALSLHGYDEPSSAVDDVTIESSGQAFIESCVACGSLTFAGGPVYWEWQDTDKEVTTSAKLEFVSDQSLPIRSGVSRLKYLTKRPDFQSLTASDLSGGEQAEVVIEGMVTSYVTPLSAESIFVNGVAVESVDTEGVDDPDGPDGRGPFTRHFVSGQLKLGGETTVEVVAQDGSGNTTVATAKISPQYGEEGAITGRLFEDVSLREPDADQGFEETAFRIRVVNVAESAQSIEVDLSTLPNSPSVQLDAQGGGVYESKDLWVLPEGTDLTAIDGPDQEESRLIYPLRTWAEARHVTSQGARLCAQGIHCGAFLRDEEGAASQGLVLSHPQDEAPFDWLAAVGVGREMPVSQFMGMMSLRGADRTIVLEREDDDINSAAFFVYQTVDPFIVTPENSGVDGDDAIIARLADLVRLESELVGFCGNEEPVIGAELASVVRPEDLAETFHGLSLERDNLDQWTYSAGEIAQIFKIGYVEPDAQIRFTSAPADDTRDTLVLTTWSGPRMSGVSTSYALSETDLDTNVYIDADGLVLLEILELSGAGDVEQGFAYASYTFDSVAYSGGYFYETTPISNNYYMKGLRDEVQLAFPTGIRDGQPDRVVVSSEALGGDVTLRELGRSSELFFSYRGGSPTFLFLGTFEGGGRFAVLRGPGGFQESVVLKTQSIAPGEYGNGAEITPIEPWSMDGSLLITGGNAGSGEAESEMWYVRAHSTFETLKVLEIDADPESTTATFKLSSGDSFAAPLNVYTGIPVFGNVRIRTGGDEARDGWTTSAIEGQTLSVGLAP